MSVEANGFEGAQGKFERKIEELWLRCQPGRIIGEFDISHHDIAGMLAGSPLANLLLPAGSILGKEVPWTFPGTTEMGVMMPLLIARQPESAILRVYAHAPDGVDFTDFYGCIELAYARNIQYGVQSIIFLDMRVGKPVVGRTTQWFAGKAEPESTERWRAADEEDLLYFVRFAHQVLS